MRLELTSQRILLRAIKAFLLLSTLLSFTFHRSLGSKFKHANQIKSISNTNDNDPIRPKKDLFESVNKPV